jgi:uncharacterized protein (DUF4415 family)
MKTKYDLSKAKPAKQRQGLKVQKSFRVDPEVLLWLEEQGEKHGMGYQTFLNWYLSRQMAEEKTFDERLAKIEAEVFKKKRA